MAQALAVAGAAMSVAGGAITARGQIAQGDAAYAEGVYNSNMAREDAGIAASQTKADIAKTRNEQDLQTGKVKAAAGVTGGMTGSNLDILASNAVQQELDILNIKQQGALKQRSLLSQASLDIAAGENAKKQSKLAAAGTMLSSLSSGASSLASAKGGGR